jgi:hypothetical protein
MVVMTRRLVTLVLVAAWALSATGTASAQPNVSFGEATASGSFGDSLRFETVFRSDTPPARVEMLWRAPGDRSDRVSAAIVERRDDTTYTATVHQAGHIVPNTRYDYRFRVVTEDGPFVGPTASHVVTDARADWESMAGDVVTVWWHDGNEAFARRALDIAEEALDAAADLLGVDDVEPVDFFIYSDSQAFRQAMGPSTRENVGGQAHPRIRTLFGLIEPRQIGSDWVEELVTHELTHLVFDEAVRNPYQYPPRWMNEGLAVYLSKGYRGGDQATVERAAGSDTIIPLEGLGGQFPTRPGRISLAYAESVAAVDYFVETYGEERLVTLITSFADGTGLDDAFIAATDSDFAAFDTAWLAALGADPPEPYGPRAGEPGTVPDAWASGSDALLP